MSRSLLFSLFRPGAKSRLYTRPPALLIMRRAKTTLILSASDVLRFPIEQTNMVEGHQASDVLLS